MTIHHNTLKKAAAIGVELVEEAHDLVRVTCQSPAFEFAGSNAKQVLELAVILKPFLTEYPWFEFNQEGEQFVIECGPAEYSDIGEDLEDMIARALEEVPEAPEGAVDILPDDEEQESTGSIVKAKYRAEYKARGDQTRCLDWLCEQIDPWVTETTLPKSGKGKVKRVGNVEKTYALARANGISKEWRNLNRGGQCMNARNMIRAVVVRKGVLVMPQSLTGEPDREIQADLGWLADKRRQINSL